jgi:hypothetical protein
MIDRTSTGQFAKGNPGGPGRPRRAVEQEYLAVLSEAVPLDTWRAICERAAKDAKAGDHRARDWLSRYLLDGNLAARIEMLELVLKLRGEGG